MGTLFSASSIMGDSAINGVNSDLYQTDVSIGSPVDNSQYSDAGQDPTSGGGGDWASTFSTVVNDAFKAFSVAQTPTSYRAASPNSPAAIQATAAATASKQQSQMIMFGGIIVVLIVLYMLFKK